MSCKQDRQAPSALASKPSVAFSTTSAASATSAATSRSGGSKLLFGEIDTNSDRSSQSYASVCSFVLCESSTFLKFWLEDKCRERFLSHVETDDLASLRLTCHDFSVRAAPALFKHLDITFRSSSFTRPSRLAALDRLGFYVQTLKFNLPHSSQTFLPPLVDPDSGAELSFTYSPQTEAPTAKHPKYGDLGTTEILTRQWPALFHAATNVPAFIRAFSSFINLSHLTISCPGYDAAQRYRRSIVDFALISLRIAVERNNLNGLESLTINPIHPGGLLYLLPLPGYGATPRSARRWSRIKDLTIRMDSSPLAHEEGEPDHFKILQTYLRNFQPNLTALRFRWNGEKGPIPIHRTRLPPPNPNTLNPSTSQAADPSTAATTTTTTTTKRRRAPGLYFPNLRLAEFENAKARASDISSFAEAHKRTIEQLNLEDVQLAPGSGTWEDALKPLTKLDRTRPAAAAAAAYHYQHQQQYEMAEIPIMLSPTTAKTYPMPMERVEVACREQNGRGSLRLSRWLSCKGRVRAPTAAKKVREGLREVLRGSVLPWR